MLGMTPDEIVLLLSLAVAAGFLATVAAVVANDCGIDVGFEFLDLLEVDPLGGVAPGSQLFDIRPLIGAIGFEFPIRDCRRHATRAWRRTRPSAQRALSCRRH